MNPCTHHGFDTPGFLQDDHLVYGTLSFNGFYFYVDSAKTSQNWIEQGVGNPMVLTVYQRATGLSSWDMYLQVPAGGISGPAIFKARAYNPQQPQSVSFGVASCAGCTEQVVQVPGTGNWADVQAAVNVTDGNVYLSLGSLPASSSYGIKFDWIEICKN
jgi:hypothetical protein